VRKHVAWLVSVCDREGMLHVWLACLCVREYGACLLVCEREREYGACLVSVCVRDTI